MTVMYVRSSATWGLALSAPGAAVPEEPVPAAVDYKASSPTLALDEAARLSERFSCFFSFVSSDCAVGPVPEHPLVQGANISVQVHQGGDGLVW